MCLDVRCTLTRNSCRRVDAVGFVFALQDAIEIELINVV